MKTAKAEKIGKTLPMHLSQIEKALTYICAAAIAFDSASARTVTL